MDDRTRRRLADVERKRAELAAQIDALDAEERMLLEHALRAIRENPGPAVRRGLRARREYDTLKTRMDTAALPAKPRRGRPMLSKHAFPLRLKQMGLTVVDVAKALRLERTTVRSWYAVGDAARAIPERFAAILEREPYLIPRSAWVNGITD